MIVGFVFSSGSQFYIDNFLKESKNDGKTRNANFLNTEQCLDMIDFSNCVFLLLSKKNISVLR